MKQQVVAACSTFFLATVSTASFGAEGYLTGPAYTSERNLLLNTVPSRIWKDIPFVSKKQKKLGPNMYCNFTDVPEEVPEADYELSDPEQMLSKEKTFSQFGAHEKVDKPFRIYGMSVRELSSGIFGKMINKKEANVEAYFTFRVDGLYREAKEGIFRRHKLTEKDAIKSGSDERPRQKGVLAYRERYAIGYEKAGKSLMKREVWIEQYLLESSEGSASKLILNIVCKWSGRDQI